MKISGPSKSAFEWFLVDSVYTYSITEALRDGLEEWEVKRKATLKDLLKKPAADY